MPRPGPVARFLALLLALVALAGAAAAGNGKQAVIFLDDNVTDWERMFQSPRILYEKSWYEDQGYTVTLRRAADREIVAAVMNPDVGAVSFFGHGYDPTAPEATSSMMFIDASGWSNRIFRALRQKYIDEGLSGSAATAKARKERDGIKLDTLRVHACSSLVDTKLAMALVRPGGSYYGVSGLYAPCPTPSALFMDVSFMLQLYVVPGAPQPAESLPYDPTLPGGPCAVDLGPAGGCGPGFETGCIPCPNRDQGIQQWYIPPQP